MLRIFMILIFFAFSLEAQLLESPKKNKYKHFFSAFALFQQEAPYLREWIEYHKLMGVEHFYLYNNNSSDNYLEILKPYIDAGEVDLIDWPSPQHANWTPFQYGALNDAVNRASKETRWLAIIDIDEFFLPLDWCSLTEMLDEHEEYGQIVVMWRYYGTSNVEKIPEDKLLIETLLHREEFIPGKVNQSKPIVKPQLIEKADIHECRLKPNHMTKYYNDGQQEYPPVLLNHYWTRDLNFLLNVKRERQERHKRVKWTEEDIQHYSNIYNEVFDEIMLFFVPYVREAMFGEKPEETLFSR